MVDALIIYSLATYMVYYVVGQSDLLAASRAWVSRKLPGWLIYPLGCSLCFAWWLTLVLGVLGFVALNVLTLFAAPVVNLVLDLIVKALIRANEPSVIGAGKTLTCGDQSVTTWSGPTVVSAMAASSLRAGEMVCVAPLAPFTGTNPVLAPWKGSLPEGWQMVNPYGYGDVPGCPKLVGRRVCFGWSPAPLERTGTIEEGYRDGDDCSGTWGMLKVRIRGDDKQTYSTGWHHCTLLD